MTLAINLNQENMIAKLQIAACTYTFELQPFSSALLRQYLTFRGKMKQTIRATSKLKIIMWNIGMA